MVLRFSSRLSCSLGMSAICLLFLFGCQTHERAPEVIVTPPPIPKPPVRQVKSADGSVEGTIVGTPASGSKFAQLQIGMTLAQVEKLIGPPNKTTSRVTGNQFHPFYSGGDTKRIEAFYVNEGQLTFSNLRQEDAPDTLIRIMVKPHPSGGP